MDAHVFRLIAQELALYLRGARVEKIHSPAPGLFALTAYNFGLRRIIIMRHEKAFQQGLGRTVSTGQAKEPPCIYWTAQKLPNPEKPSTQVMTLRKYLSGRRLGAASIDWLNRRIFFYVKPVQNSLGLPKGMPTDIWFCLDLHNGPHLLHEAPEMQEPVWPEAAMLEPDMGESLANPSFWKSFAVLTPPLRRTLLALDKGEALALLADLSYESEKGCGGLFMYYFDNKPHLLSPWPLPASLKQNMQEAELPLSPACDPGFSLKPGDSAPVESFTYLEAAREVHEPKVISFLGLSLQKEQVQEEKSSTRRLRNTMKKLEQEQERLVGMLALREQAILLQSVLWRYDTEQKYPKLCLEAGESPDGHAHVIELDGRKTLGENMEHMFKQAKRGARGLEFLDKRRKEVQDEITALQNGLTLPKSIEQKKPGKTAPPPSGISKLVQRFVSSDGFVILRGRSAQGNHAILKLAQPHDLWLHVQGGPSAHVVIRRPNFGVEIPEQTLLEAGVLSGLKSWRKHDDRAEIISALVKDVRPVKGGAAGAVLVDLQQGSFMVRLNPDIEEKLKD